MVHKLIFVVYFHGVDCSGRHERKQVFQREDSMGRKTRHTHANKQKINRQNLEADDIVSHKSKECFFRIRGIGQ